MTPNVCGSVLLVERKIFAVPSGVSVTSLCATEDISSQLSPTGISRYLKCHITISPGVGEELRGPCAP